MDNLLKEKDKLQQKIDHINASNNQKLETIKQIKKEIDTLDIKIKYESSKIDDINTLITAKLDDIKELESEVFKYENTHKEQMKGLLEEEYKYYIEKTNKIKFKNKEDYKKHFNLLKKILNRSSKFKRLHNRLYDLYNKEQKSFILYAISNIKKYESDVRDIEKMSKAIAFVVETEAFFSQDIFVNFVFENVSKGFSYNFFSARKTNRLDKPEWFVEFLMDRLAHEKRKILIYQGLKNDNKLFDELRIKIEGLINQKFGEILKSESEQKRELMLHFVDELGVMINHFEEMFGYKISFEPVKTTFLEKEKEYVKQRMKDIHLDDHEKWFEEYQKLISECFINYKTLHSFDPGLLSEVISYVLNDLVIFFRLLTKRMQFITKEETYFMCYVFSEIEELKIFIQSKQNDLSSFIKTNVTIDLHSLSLLNSENLKLLKSAINDDLDFYLKKIKNFKYIQERIIVNTRLDITNYMSVCRKKMKRGYNTIERHTGGYIDNYFFENILLKTRFDMEEFERFKNFYNQIKDIFCVYGQWKSDIAVKCVNDILNGKKPIDKRIESIFNILYDLYEDDFY